MKITFKKSLIALPLSASLLMVSCGGNPHEGDDMSHNDTIKVDSSALAGDMEAELNFQVPSPGEMLSFIKVVGGKNNKNTTFLNSIENNKNYNDSKTKALNFGVYSCDLSYCSIFEMGVEAFKYFKVVKQLGDEIGVSTSIDAGMAKRLETNVGNPDSLAAITDDLYYNSFDALQNGKQGNVLALVVAGGYIESLYIVTNLVKYDAKNPAVQRVADQKYTLENIIDFLKKYESDAAVAEVITTLNGLKTEFDALKETSAEEIKGKDGVKVLGGGTTLEITAEQYKSISEKIKSIRNSFTLSK